MPDSRKISRVYDEISLFALIGPWVPPACPKCLFQMGERERPKKENFPELQSPIARAVRSGMGGGGGGEKNFSAIERGDRDLINRFQVR